MTKCGRTIAFTCDLTERGWPTLSVLESIGPGAPSSVSEGGAFDSCSLHFYRIKLSLPFPSLSRDISTPYHSIRMVYQQIT